jgi:hypothetical protein
VQEESKMRTPLVGGVVLGVLVTLWSIVVVETGWYKDQAMVWTFWVVVLIEIAVLVWTLRRTAAEGRTYGQQVVAGVVASVVGGVLIFAGSFLITTVLEPGYFSEIKAMGVQLARGAGQGEAEVQALLDAPLQTPAQGALGGLIGTVATGLLVSLILAAFLRVKRQAAMAVR